MSYGLLSPRLARRCVAAASAPLLAACVSARPVRDWSGLPAGQNVEAELTPRGTDALTPVLGPQVVRVEGRVLAAAGDTLTLALRRTEKENGRDEPWQQQRVVLPPGTVGRVSVRRVDTARSWLVAVAGVAGAVALGLGFARGNGGGGDSGGGVSPPN